MKLNTSFKFVLLNFIFFSLLSLVNTAQNTHQNITFQLPPIKPYRITLKYGDQLQVNLYDTNAKFLIAFMSLDKKYLNTQSGHCFKQKVCSLAFQAGVYVTGFIFISIQYSHQYSYQIVLNSKTLKKQKIVANTQADVFIYPKQLPTATYNLKFYYDSDIIKSIDLQILKVKYQIKRGKIKQINITLKQPKNVYSLDFHIPQIDVIQMQHQFSVKITALIPNQMLKGCNGQNYYNQKLRACGELIPKNQDNFVLHRYGVYPHFTLLKEQVVNIKLTVDQFKHFMPILQNQLITVFLIHEADPRSFKQKPISWILQNYQTQYQQTKFTNTSCWIYFTLQPGRYTFIPFLTNNFPEIAFVYLFQRYNGLKVLVQNYYSVFQSYYNDKQKDYNYFYSAIMEFTSTTTHKNQLVQIDIISPDNQLVVVAYNIFRKIPNSYQQSIKFQIIQLGLQNSFSSNMKKISIITQNIQANRSYLFYVQFHSKQFFIQHYQNGTDKYQIHKTDPYLQNSTLQFRIINGLFPHKKIDQNRIQDDFFQQQPKYSNKIILFFGILVIGIVVIFLTSIYCLIKYFRRKQQISELETKKLLDEYRSMIQQNLQVKYRQGTNYQRNNILIQKQQQSSSNRYDNNNIIRNEIRKEAEQQFQQNSSTLQSERKSQVQIQMTLTQFNHKNNNIQK